MLPENINPPSDQAPLSVKSTSAALRILEKIINARITVEGLADVPERPTLFVINHFTRIETMLLPHLIYRETGRYPRSLADAALFDGPFGDYITSLRVTSVKAPHRDQEIIGDLMTGRSNWVIYPEGLMAKSKKILNKRKLILTTQHGDRPVRTGAAMLALKAEIYKQKFFTALAKNDRPKMRDYCNRFDFFGQAELSSHSVQIVPVTISYYPLRPGDNAIKALAKRLFDKLPPRLEEELEIEGNFLLSDSTINVCFAKPIAVADYLDRQFLLSRLLAYFMPAPDQPSFLLRQQATALTRDFMGRIYDNLLLNIDHLFCQGLQVVWRPWLNAENFYRAIYITGLDAQKRFACRSHDSLGEGLIRLIADEPYPPLESICRLAEQSSVVRRAGEALHINKVKLEMIHLFHTVRVNNPFLVIANEAEPLGKVVKELKFWVNTRERLLREKTLEKIIEADHDRFANDYVAYYEAGVSKDRQVGSPFLLRSAQSKIGVVLSHGYLAAPKEIAALAEYLYQRGYSVYGVRLPGFGTSPRNQADVLWTEWYDAYLRGYAALKQFCNQIVLGGFSTGGTLALTVGGIKRPPVRGIFAISSPIHLKYIRARSTAAVNLWNDWLERLNVESGRLEWVDNLTENPDTNYNKIYLKGLRQMDYLMRECRQRLGQITAPVTLIHSRQDPAVNPESSQEILDQISSADKSLELFDLDRHVIVRHAGSEQVFAAVGRFVERVCERDWL